MSGNVLYEMPLYQRYVNSTLNLVPGMSSGGFAYGGDLGSYHLAGQRNGAIGIFEDGVNGNDQGSGTGTIKPLQNSVAEVNVLTTVPPAEYGHSAGGVISVVKKSGTNEIHGMASWFGRTRMMQHRRYFDGKKTSDPYPGRPNGLPVFFMQPDANIGGPVFIPKIYNGKNKTFFFFGYQRLHEKKAAQLFQTTPTVGHAAGHLQLPGVATNAIYDPSTTRRNADGTWARDPFPGNMIPVNRFDPVARKVLDDCNPWVLPNQPGSFTSTGPSNNVLANEFARTFFNDYNVRLDHQFSSAFKIYGSLTENDQSGFGRPKLIQEDLLAFDAVDGNLQPVQAAQLIGGLHVGDLERGGQRFACGLLPAAQRHAWCRRWAATGRRSSAFPNVDNSLMPVVRHLQRHGSDAEQDGNETLSWRNDTTWVKGQHAFKFGYEILRFRLNSANFARFSSFSFSGVTSGLQPNGTAIPNTGIDFAGFLTGYVRSATYNKEITSWLPRSTIHSFYIQDDWKITPRLTANIGVRYSNESPFNTKNGLMSNFDPNGTDDLTGGKGAIIHPTRRAVQARQQQLQSAVRPVVAPAAEVGVPRRHRHVHGGHQVPAIARPVRRVCGYGDPAGQPGRSDADLPDQQGSGAGELQHAAERDVAVPGNELQLAQRRVVGSEPAQCVRAELQRQRAARVHQELPAGGELPGIVRGSAWWNGGSTTRSRSITSRETRRSRMWCWRRRRITGRSPPSVISGCAAISGTAHSIREP